MLGGSKFRLRQGFVLRTKRLYAPFGAPHRRRKVRLSPFPPDGENCARSLAPPLPTRPAAAGLGRGPLYWGPEVYSMAVKQKKAGPFWGPLNKAVEKS